MNPKVDAFLANAKKWRDEFEALRNIILPGGLTEELKWGVPCYTLEGRNVVLIHGFKEYCALLFFKGALIPDTAGILIRQSENVQSSRQVRFTGLPEIESLLPVLKSYVLMAIEVEKAGLKVEFKPTAGYSIPEEFQQKLDELPAFKTAFEALTPGRQRAYLLHFSQPKTSATKVSRIEKCLPRILAGKGLNDL